jgi:hypothetical protein
MDYSQSKVIEAIKFNKKEIVALTILFKSR